MPSRDVFDVMKIPPYRRITETINQTLFFISFSYAMEKFPFIVKSRNTCNLVDVLMV